MSVASKRSADVKARRAAVVERGDDPPFCSWYYDTLTLFDTRDLVLHDRLEKLRRSAGASFEAQVDEAVRNLASWAEHSGATSIGDLDAANRTG